MIPEPKKVEEQKPGFVIQRLDERRSERSPISLLYYGGSGTGKTFFLGTAGSRSVIIDTGHGPIDTLKSSSFKSMYPANNPMIVSVREHYTKYAYQDPATRKTTDLEIPTGEAFDMVCDALDYALDQYGDEIDTVSVDIATGIRRFAMNKGLTISGDLGRSKTLTNVVKKYGLVVPAIQDFGMEMNIVEWFVSTFTEKCKSLGKNFILTAHVRETYEKPDKIGDIPKLLKIRPGFTGQTFPDDIPGLFDEVWYAERTGKGNAATWRCKCYGDEQLTAKTTYGSGVLTNAEVNPNFLKMLDRIWTKTGATN